MHFDQGEVVEHGFDHRVKKGGPSVGKRKAK